MKDATFFFAECPACSLPSHSILDGRTTCCIIKPHAYKEGYTYFANKIQAEVTDDFCI